MLALHLLKKLTVYSSLDCSSFAYVCAFRIFVHTSGEKVIKKTSLESNFILVFQPREN